MNWTEKILDKIQARIAEDKNLNTVEAALGYFFDLEESIFENDKTEYVLDEEYADRSAEMIEATYALLRENKSNYLFKEAYQSFNKFEPQDLGWEAFGVLCALCYKNKGKPAYNALAKSLKKLL